MLADLEAILFSGHAAPHHPKYFPKDFEFPQLMKPLPFLPQPPPKQHPHKPTEDDKKQQKPTIDVSDSPPRKPLAKVTSPQKSRKTSPQKHRPSSPTSPQKPPLKSPYKRTTVSKSERNRSNSPPDAKTRRTDSSPPPNKTRKVDSSPPQSKTRGKETSPQRSKQKLAAGKISKQNSVYEYHEDSPPKKRRYRSLLSLPLLFFLILFSF